MSEQAYFDQFHAWDDDDTFSGYLFYWRGDTTLHLAIGNRAVLPDAPAHTLCGIATAELSNDPPLSGEPSLCPACQAQAEMRRAQR